MISNRAKSVDSSGIRRVFDLAAGLKDPINLSIGQPDFDAFEIVKESAIAAIKNGKNGYTQTQGITELRVDLKNFVGIDKKESFDLFVTSGVTAGLLLSYMTILDPGDEVLIPDPYFCMYRDLAYMINAIPVYYDTYPNFSLDVEKIERQITLRTKAILVNSPSNPTGHACAQSELDAVVELAKKHNLVLIYDEIYSNFCFDVPHAQIRYNYEKVIVLNGFSKSAGVPGWRMGYVVGPSIIVNEMLKLQQYTFVCAHQPSQWAMREVLKYDFSEHLKAYKAKRDFIVSALMDKYNFVTPQGAFYLFPEAPGGDGQAFVEHCIENSLLVVPGNVFSTRNSHFRISFSAPMPILERGVEVLRKI